MNGAGDSSGEAPMRHPKAKWIFTISGKSDRKQTRTWLGLAWLSLSKLGLARLGLDWIWNRAFDPNSLTSDTAMHFQESLFLSSKSGRQTAQEVALETGYCLAKKLATQQTNK